MKAFLKVAGWTHEDFAIHIDETHNDPDQIIGIDTVKSWTSPKRNRAPDQKHREILFIIIKQNASSDLATEWIKAFKTCWMNNVLKDNQEQSSKIVNSHRNWIKQKYLEPIKGENFTIEDIFVPLQLIHHDQHEHITNYNKGADIHTLEKFALTGMCFKDDEPTSVLFVKGGPGSGKSIFALSLATKLAENNPTICPLFIRLSRNALSIEIKEDTIKINDDNSIDDSFSYKSLLEQFKKSKYQSCCLILDGLDEVGKIKNPYQQSVALEILTDIEKHILDCERQYEKTLRVITFGRETIAETLAIKFETARHLFSMGDLSGEIGQGKGALVYGSNMKPIWWSKFLTAKGNSSERTIPKFLSDPEHSLYELGKEPLLCYLIVSSVFGIGNSLPNNARMLLDEQLGAMNRNDIYDKIIRDILDPKKWKSSPKRNPILNYENFRKVLQYISLATWQNGTSKEATVSAIKSAIGTKIDVARSFEKLLTFNQEDSKDIHSAILITAFYYRIAQKQNADEEPEFEFTHKTFSEYLLVSLLFDQFEILVELEYSDADKNVKQDAIWEWLRLVDAGPQTNDLAAFIVDEAKSRYSNKPFDLWCEIFDVIAHIYSTDLPTIPPTEEAQQTFDNVSTLKRGALFLFCMWSSLNRVHWRETGEHYKVEVFEKMFNLYDFQLSQPISAFVRTPNKDVIKTLGDTSFTGYCLSGISLEEESLHHIVCDGGEVVGFKSSEAIMALGVWSEVKFLNCWFEETNFTQSMFYKTSFSNKTKILKSNFQRSCFFQCTFRDVIFEKVNFDSCSFRECKFTNCDFTKIEAKLAEFDECHFDDECNFTKTSLKNCLSLNSIGLPELSG